MRQRRKRYYKLRFFLLLMVASLLVTQAFAVDYACDSSIPVEVRVIGTTETLDVAVTLTLTPDDSSNPMPDQTEISMTESGTGVFGPIHYTEPGEYHYTITQGNANDRKLVCSTKSYSVTIRVMNNEAGGLSSVIWAVADGSEDKAGEIIFRNEYHHPGTPTTHLKPTQNMPTTEGISYTVPTATALAASSPKTGDETNLVVLGCLMGISLLGLIGVTIVFCWSKKHS